ncbi:MAG: hypothetical protein ACKPKO_59365 [Candidatus Fonsibacter sp.]
MFLYSLLKTNGNIIVGSYSGPTGWADKCKFEPTGNGDFVGTVRGKSGLNVGDPAIYLQHKHNIGT